MGTVLLPRNPRPPPRPAPREFRGSRRPAAVSPALGRDLREPAARRFDPGEEVWIRILPQIDEPGVVLRRALRVAPLVVELREPFEGGAEEVSVAVRPRDERAGHAETEDHRVGHVALVGGERGIDRSGSIVRPGHARQGTEGTPIGIALPVGSDRVVEAALGEGALPGFARARLLRREVPHGDSRIDFLLESGRRELLLEVKSVAWACGRRGLFPDAPTARGRRHVEELTRYRLAGGRAAVVFLAQRSDIDRVSPHPLVDPGLARALREARRAGVAIRAYGCLVGERGVRLVRELPVELRYRPRLDTSGALTLTSMV